jgi:hypothetical protein
VRVARNFETLLWGLNLAHKLKATLCGKRIHSKEATGLDFAQ